LQVPRELLWAIVFSLAVFVAALWPSQYPYSQTPEIKTEQQSDSAAKSQPESNHRATPSDPNATAEQQHPTNDPKGEADKDADKRAEEVREYWPFHILGARLKITDSLLALFTFLLIIVGAVQGIFLFRTDRGTHKAADAALRSSEVAEAALFVAQRPYVFVTAASFKRPLSRETFDYSGPEIWLWVKFKLENHGRTPANIVEICADSACVNKLPAIPQYREQTTYDTPHLLGADKETTVGYLFKTPIDGQVMNDIAVGRFMGGRRLFAFGYIKYRDIFDYTNTVGFCWRYNLDLKSFIPALEEEGYTYRKSEPPKAL
jgi:hypothetical protein